MHEPFGPIRFSFREAPGPIWAGLALGLALIAAGALLGLVFTVEGTAHASPEDARAVVILLAMTAGSGLLVTPLALYGLVRRAEWHVTSTHLYRTRGARVLRSHELAKLPAPLVTDVYRYGQLIGVRVSFGEPRWNEVQAPGAFAPSRDVATAIADAWQAARR